MPNTPWGEAALSGELEKLARAVKGERNTVLNRTSFKVAQLVGAGHVDSDDAYTRLHETAIKLGTDRSFTEADIRRTIASARNGERHPRDPAARPPAASAPEFAQPHRDGPPADSATSSQGEGEAPPSFDHLYMDATKLGDLPKPEPLIEDVLDGRALFSITGRDRSFKSFLALDWLCCLATGKAWLGHEVRRVKTLYVVGEGAYGLDARREAWEAAWQTRIGPGWLTIRVAPVNLFSKEEDAIKPALADLIERVRAERYGVVLFDTLARNATGGNLNLPDDASMVIARLDRVRRVADGGSVGFVGHTGKSDLDTRGASNLEDDLDIVWHLQRDDDSGEIVAKLRKRKDGPDDAEIKLQPRPVAGTGSLVLAVSTGLGSDAMPARALDVMRLLAGSAVREDGLSMTAVANALGLHGKGSVTHTFTWLKDRSYVDKLGTGRNTRWILSPSAFVRLREIGEIKP